MQINIHLEDSLYDSLKAKAFNSKQSMSLIVREALVNTLDVTDVTTPVVPSPEKTPVLKETPVKVIPAATVKPRKKLSKICSKHHGLRVSCGCG